MTDGQEIDTDRRVAMNHPDVVAVPEIPSACAQETSTFNQHQSAVAEIVMQSSDATVGAPTATEAFLLPPSSTLMNTSPPLLQTTLPSQTAKEVFVPPLSTSNTPPPPLESQPPNPTQITAAEQQPILQQQLLSHVLEDLNSSSQSSSMQWTAQPISAQHVEIGEQSTIVGGDVALQQWDNVDMCKSNILPFNFETSLLRDESKLSVIFKSLPEYADATGRYPGLQLVDILARH